MSQDKEILRLHSAAESGDANAQCELALKYANGTGVPQDQAEAAWWFHEAAARGHTHAQSWLGWMYDTGKGVDKDPVEAVRWYRSAAEQGDASAQYNLAVRYDAGSGVPKDVTEAARLYRQAADKGHANALHNLAMCYEKGSGVPQDKNEAVRLFRKAAAKGNENAKKQLARLNVPIEEPTPQRVPPTKRTSAQNKGVTKEPPKKQSKSSGETAECKPLLEACTPLVYRYNAFRITGLAVDATIRQIKRRIDDLKAVEETGDAEEEHTHAFALDPTPTLEQIQEAAQRLLQDPERRIIEEFFWFWPLEWGKAISDPALNALKGRDQDRAYKIWSQTLKYENPQLNAVAKHNLAVMYQLVALDSEHLALGNQLEPDQHATITKYWHTCFKWWEEIRQDDVFWSLVTDRIRMIDDPRLTTGFARRIRANFPVAFDRINAQLAMKFAETGQFDSAKKHIQYMKETQQGSDNIDHTISIIIKPIETRINSAVETACEAARKNPKNAANCARELMETTKKPLAIVKNLLDETHSIRSYLFEQVTDTCFTCLITYANATEDWPTCVTLLKQTESLAITDEALAGLLVGEQIDTKMRLPPGVSPQSSASQFPPIKELKGKGWCLGSQPSA